MDIVKVFYVYVNGREFCFLDDNYSEKEFALFDEIAKTYCLDFVKEKGIYNTEANMEAYNLFVSKVAEAGHLLKPVKVSHIVRIK